MTPENEPEDPTNKLLEINENTLHLYDRVENFINAPVLLKSGKGYILPSECAIYMKLKGNTLNPPKNEQELSSILRVYFTDKRPRYISYGISDESFMLFDMQTHNKVQISIENRENTQTIIIYPFRNCKGETVRTICEGIKHDCLPIESIKLMEFHWGDDHDHDKRN
jgi:hypothetical protein